MQKNYLGKHIIHNQISYIPSNEFIANLKIPPFPYVWLMDLAVNILTSRDRKNGFDILFYMNENKNMIFYSWQSDLPKETTCNAIRKALRKVKEDLKAKKIDITLEEATRNTPGSPNIIQEIFTKINASDIFICDLTTINKFCDTCKRKTPNPNVLIELGYAISILGWKRIIILFNTEYGEFEKDLPFDIDKHRITPYLFKDEKDTASFSKFYETLKEAIKTIVTKNPPKAFLISPNSTAKRQRDRDIEKTQEILETIHLSTFDDFISNYPNKIPVAIFFFEEYFQTIRRQKAFHLYDNVLLEHLDEFGKKWDESISFDQHYTLSQNGHYHIFNRKFSNANTEKDLIYMQNLRTELNNALAIFLDFIRENYDEIDISACSQKASEAYRNSDPD